jgi:ankyrin repeat protein
MLIVDLEALMARILSGLVLGLSLLAAGCRPPEPTAPLVKAAARGDLADLDRLLAGGGDPNELDPNGMSALALAARGGHLATLERLAKAGANLNIHDATENRWTPLLHAIHTKREAAVRTLLDLGANPSSDSPYGATPLIMAASYGLTDVVGWLLDAGADAYATQKSGDNALAAAVSGATDIDRWTLGHCQTDAVQLLLRRAPGLRMPPTFAGSMALWAARIGSCQDVLDLVQAPGRKR